MIFLVPGFLLEQFIPKKTYTFFFWCVLQTRVVMFVPGSLNVAGVSIVLLQPEASVIVGNVATGYIGF